MVEARKTFKGKKGPKIANRKHRKLPYKTRSFKIHGKDVFAKSCI